MLLTDRVPINVPGRPMLQRAWNVPAGSVVLAALVSLALSTQLMFQRQLYDQWSPGQIAGAWLQGWASLAVVAGVILGTLALAGRVPVQGRLLRLAWFAIAVLAGALAGEWLVLWYQWGIVLGWEVDDETWNRAVATALSRPTIVQERIGLPAELFPSLADGEVVFAERIVDTAPFCFDGAFVDGCLTRVSTASLVNVTAGGGSTIPTFVVEPRDR